MKQLLVASLAFILSGVIFAESKNAEETKQINQAVKSITSHLKKRGTSINTIEVTVSLSKDSVAGLPFQWKEAIGNLRKAPMELLKQGYLNNCKVAIDEASGAADVALELVSNQTDSEAEPITEPVTIKIHFGASDCCQDCYPDCKCKSRTGKSCGCSTRKSCSTEKLCCK